MVKIKNCVMCAYAMFLCVIMASIFLRFFTVHVLVKQMQMDNAFTRCVLFDAEKLQRLEKRAEPKPAETKKEKTRKTIDWAMLYPFEESREEKNVAKQEKTVDDVQQPMKRWYLIDEKVKIAENWIKAYKEKINNWATKYLAGYMASVEWANVYKQKIGWNIPVVGGKNSVAEIEDGQLTTFAAHVNTGTYSDAVIDFSRFCEKNGARFLYVHAFSHSNVNF